MKDIHDRDEKWPSGSDRSLIKLNVNGIEHRLHVESDITLAEALRGPLALTGTKIACNRGACGACTVLLDGQAVCACMIFAIDVGQRAVTTIEGLCRDHQLHPIQESFLAHDAVQCGFCTPGLVISAAALLESNPHPMLDEIKAALSGHLCRCGTHPHIYEAVLAASTARIK